MVKLIFIAILYAFSAVSYVESASLKGKEQYASELRLNTSNRDKLREFQRIFNKYNCRITVTRQDLDEIDADPISVVAHKASQFEEGILVDDTSLDVEGADIGVNLKWLQDNIEELIGRRAVITVLLGYRFGNTVYIYEGKVAGTLVSPRGKAAFALDTLFLPDGATKTLAESKPDTLNARALAVEALIDGKPIAIVGPVEEWNGPWQHAEGE